MKISELQPNQGHIDLDAEIKELSPTRTIGDGQIVRTAIIEDDTGKARLDLWNKYAETFSVGNHIHLSNGMAKTKYEGILNITHGKYGTIKKVENHP